MNIKKHAWWLLVIIFVGILIRVITAGGGEDIVHGEGGEVTTPEEPAPVIYLGIEVDTLNHEEHTIASGESFGVLLGKRGFTSAEIYNIAETVKETFDVRRIRAEVTTRFLKGPNSQKPTYFIYPKSKFEYHIIQLQDSVYASTVVKEKEIRRRTVSGVVEDALSLSIGRAGGTNALSNEVVNIYAWSIDFFRLQKGDQFQIIYEEGYVDDTVYVGLERIVAANINHFGEDYYAFPFLNEHDLTDYFDEEGRSLRKTFLRAPLNYTRISSRYSGRRFHPVQKRWKAHLGTDYAAPTGTPIMSTADGVVSKAGYTSGNGNYVKVRHNSKYSTQYLHMSKIAKGMRAGTKVRQGQVIGYVGQTGLATGPHVCYRFWVNGRQVDPYKQKLPDAEPLPAEKMDAFKQAYKPLYNELQQLK